MQFEAVLLLLFFFLQCKAIFNIWIYLFLTSLLNLQGFPFTHSSSCHPKPGPISLLIPAAPPTKENKTGKQAKKQSKTKYPPKPKQNQNHSRNRKISSSLLTFYHLFICPDDIGGFGVSYSRPFCLINSTSKCSLQWVTGLVPSLWFFRTKCSLGPHQSYSAESCGRPESWISWTSLFMSTSRTHMG